MRIEGRLISVEVSSDGNPSPELRVVMSVKSITDPEANETIKGQEFVLMSSEEADDSARIKKLKDQMVELRKELGKARSEAEAMRVQVNLKEVEIAEWEQRYAQDEAERYSQFEGAGSW